MITAEEVFQSPEFVSIATETPLQARLARAILLRWEAARDSIVLGDAPRFKQLAAEVSELGSWFGDGPVVWTDEQVAREFKNNLEYGWPAEWALKAMELMRQKQRGRPTGNRRAALLALEHRQKNSGSSWSLLARRFCWCPKHAHDNHSCREQVRQQCRVLEEMLDRLGV